MKICDSCKQENADTNKFCFSCGENIEKTKKKTCPACKEPIQFYYTFCSICGQKIEG